MCQKQCRDENGFKCHLTSEGHKRQMDIFGHNPKRIIEGYSEEFEKAFLEHMKSSHPFSRIAATVVYNEFIQDRCVWGGGAHAEGRDARAACARRPAHSRTHLGPTPPRPLLCAGSTCT